MRTPIAPIAETRAQFIELVANWQKPMIDAANRTAEFLDGRLPPARNLAFASESPSLGDVVRTQFSLAEQLLEANRRFALLYLAPAKVRELRIVDDPDELGYYWVEND